MSNSINKYNPTLILSTKASADLIANRFLGFSGNYPPADAKALGVVDAPWLNDELANVIVSGTAVVETDVVVAVGDAITSDSNGKAKLVLTTEKVNGYAVTSTSGAGFVTVLLQ
jgi:hypothetical protein